MNKHVRKTVVLSIKLLLAIALLGWVVSRVHWGDYVQTPEGETYPVVQQQDERIEVATGPIWDRTSEWADRAQFEPHPDTDEVVRQGLSTTFRHVDRTLLLAAVGGFLAMLLITAVRWWWLLALVEIHIRLWEVIRLTFLGQFFNAVVPGTVGGDLVKAWYVARHTPRKGAVLVSIFVDRVVGLTELTLFAAGVVVIVWATGLADAESIRLPAIAIGIVLALVAVAGVFLFSGRVRRALHLQKLYKRLPIAPTIEEASRAARLYRRRMPAMIQALVITFAAHLIWVGSIGLLGKSLGLPTPWYAYYRHVPLIYIIGAVPLTPGGVGVIEQLFVLFFATAAGSAMGVTPSMALALALLARVVPMFWGLPGLWVALTGPKLPKTEAIQAELGLEDGDA